MAFLNLTKAFDFFNREGLWRILLKYGCPSKFVTILRLFHDNMRAVILSNGSITDSFELRRESSKAASSTRHSSRSSLPRCSTDKLQAGVGQTYRMDGKLFNLNRLRSKTKTTPTSVVKLQYAVDAEVSAASSSNRRCLC